jgi:hypothetical protein
MSKFLTDEFLNKHTDGLHPLNPEQTAVWAKEILTLKHTIKEAVFNCPRCGGYDEILHRPLNISTQDCLHPLDKRQEFKWEWDNGYGHQQSLIGHRCLVCNKINHYPMTSSGWYTKKD